jgi:hypothetical protein
MTFVRQVWVPEGVISYSQKQDYDVLTLPSNASPELVLEFIGIMNRLAYIAQVHRPVHYSSLNKTDQSLSQ